MGECSMGENLSSLPEKDPPDCSATIFSHTIYWNQKPFHDKPSQAFKPKVPNRNERDLEQRAHHPFGLTLAVNPHPSGFRSRTRRVVFVSGLGDYDLQAQI